MMFSSYSFIFVTILFVLAQAVYRPLDDIKPMETVVVHNLARAKLGVGPLIWDNKVAAHAQKYANYRSKDCAPVHSTSGLYGENIAMGWVNMSGPTATHLWLDEQKFYDYATNKCSGVCGHFTQAVANQSHRIGCGATRCHNNELLWIVCNYAPRPMGDENTRPY